MVLIWILAFAGMAAGVCTQPAALGFPGSGARALAAQPQEPQPTTPPASTQTLKPEKKKKHSHERDFLLIGTVFTEKGSSLQEAQLRIRRTSEKKFRWETLTDRRGEFAVRVQQGADYEIIVRKKGFQEQSRAVGAKFGDREDLVFRLTPLPEGKSK